MTEDKEHDKLFADLDALTEQQIDSGSGCWRGTSKSGLWSNTISMTSSSNGSKQPLTD